jgi:uncharacterized protein (DUF58 family)
MTWRVTPLARSLLTVIAWILSLAVLTARPDLFVAVLPLALVLATLAVRPSPPDCAVTHRISRDRVFEGDTVTVTVEVTARTAAPLMELYEPLAAHGTVVSGSPRAVMTLRPGETARWSYEVSYPVRGVYDLGTLVIRVRDSWSLRWAEGRYVERKRVRVHPRSAPLRGLPRPRRTQTSVGDYVSRAFGEGIEPGDIRQFAPGDRIRQVNWRASLRLGTLYVTQQHRERNADVVLMLDTMAQVGTASVTTLDAAVRAAASLATAYLARKDRVGLIVYGGVIDWVRPGSGRAHYERLADSLLRADVVFTYVTKDLKLVPPRVLPPHAFVVALTPLLDRRFTQAAVDLVGRGFDVLVLVVSPVELMRATLGTAAIDQLACRLWTLERRARLDEMRRHGLSVIEWNPGDPLEAAIAGLDRRRHRAIVAR